MNYKGIARLGFLTLSLMTAQDMSAQDVVPTEQNVIDEVIWVVGDEAILKSDVETMRLQAAQEGTKWNGDPDCVIPEQLAVQKLFLNQAELDSIEVSESDIASEAERRLEFWIENAGSREKLEEYRKASISQIRDELRDAIRNMMIVQRTREHLVSDIKVSPAEVRRYFKDMPLDSLPYVPTEVEVQILTLTPRIEQEEINRVKDELRDFTDRINKGESTFSTLARFYSEDPGSARRGGAMDFISKVALDPAFANVAFSLTDPRNISKVVESEFGFHIIQLIEKRGDKIKCRHILKKPVVSEEAVNKALMRLDSIRADIMEGAPFEAAVSFFSDDKDTRNNYGLMANVTEDARTSKFRMQDLPAEVARVVDTMSIGQVSAPFQMINARGKTVCAIVKLKNRVEGHKATINEDFQILKDVVLNKRREDYIKDWVNKKIKSTYVRISDRYKNCEFEHQGWIR